MKEFRFAIMGPGAIANRFCDAVSRLEGCSVVAVASKSMERAKTFAEKNSIPTAYDSYEAMLEEAKPDAVYLSVTQNDHYRLAMLCLEHHTAVLCEKAAFLTEADAKAVFDKARENNTFAMEAMWSRFIPSFKTVRRWLEEKRIGEIVLADCAIGFRAEKDPNNRFYNPALGGGAMYDIMVYAYEIVTGLIGKPVETAHAIAVQAFTGVDATDLVTLRFEGGIPAVLKTTILSPVEEKLIIYGTEGKIVLPHPHYTNDAWLYDADDNEIEHFSDDTENGFIYEIDEVRRCVQASLIESPVVPHADTIACAKIYDMLNESMK